MDMGSIWVGATLLGAAGQVARNAMQRQLTAKIGTAGATQVRFLYGFPFAVLFLLLVRLATGEPVPAPGAGFAGFLGLGAITQILATALMLAAMQARSFSVVTALIKTEAIQIAVFGFLFLGDRLTALGVGAVLLATAGVVLVSWTPKASGETRVVGMRPIVLGLSAGALFAFSAVGYRGAILSLASGSFLIRATTALVCGLALQTVMLLAWMAVFDRAALMGSLRHWRSSLAAGFVGATASQFWFIAFALTAAVNVRTLALVEVLMAQAVSRRLLKQSTSSREIVGMAMIVVGVLFLLASAR
ncbi:DMT family transporter [Enterovirga sp.]|uniref:DMT family transporter n=1 Tax=Enterovirga sp. TaxID=2026350 RepID=UPI002D02B216|nr:DMT family transporter [Enterovirga sp.]HMO29068.1 DMT family transporter [Enterovirga sp.]